MLAAHTAVALAQEDVVPAMKAIELLENHPHLAELPVPPRHLLVEDSLLKSASHSFDKSALPALTAYCSLYSSYHSPSHP